jgi:hypothetical protein
MDSRSGLQSAGDSVYKKVERMVSSRVDLMVAMMVEWRAENLVGMKVS